MGQEHTEGCCEHKNCYITFDMTSKEDVFTYFIMDKDEVQENNEPYKRKTWEQAAEEDTIYVFCKIHSDSLLEYMDEHEGEVSLNYMENIVKEPHFGSKYVR